MPPRGGVFTVKKTLLLFLGILAFLVRDAAAGLAGRLARSLALTAAAIHSALTEIPSLQGDNMLQFHEFVLQMLIALYTIICY